MAYILYSLLDLFSQQTAGGIKLLHHKLLCPVVKNSNILFRDTFSHGEFCLLKPHESNELAYAT